MSSLKKAFTPRKNRYFSKDFKQEKVNQILTKKLTVRELSDLYGIKAGVIYRWLKEFSPIKEPNIKISFEMENEAQKSMFYKSQNAELEQVIGKKQIEIDFLNRLIEIASDELGVDIKKNFYTKASSGSEHILKNDHSK